MEQYQEQPLSLEIETLLEVNKGIPSWSNIPESVYRWNPATTEWIMIIRVPRQFNKDFFYNNLSPVRFTTQEWDESFSIIPLSRRSYLILPKTKTTHCEDVEALFRMIMQVSGILLMKNNCATFERSKDGSFDMFSIQWSEVRLSKLNEVLTEVIHAKQALSILCKLENSISTIDESNQSSSVSTPSNAEQLKLQPSFKQIVTMNQDCTQRRSWSNSRFLHISFEEPISMQTVTMTVRDC